MNVDELTLEQLRVAIAERMGYRYYWYDGLGECYLRDLGIQNTGAMITLTRRPDDYPVNMEFVPNWPADIAAAFALVAELKTHRLTLQELHTTPGHTIWQVSFTPRDLTVIDGPLPGGCVFADAETPAEAIARAWLRARGITDER